jgi:hypothetical protein
MLRPQTRPEPWLVLFRPVAAATEFVTAVGVKPLHDIYRHARAGE